jgi:DNA-binding GntR family transcriptional regulator
MTVGRQRPAEAGEQDVVAQARELARALGAQLGPQPGTGAGAAQPPAGGRPAESGAGIASGVEAASQPARPAPGSGLEALAPTPQMQQRRTVSGEVADILRNAIYQGALEDGTPLNQVAIAKMLGVSRVPVRAAMHQLQAEGLITVRPHHAAVVTALSVDRVAELFEIQALLEEYIAERALPNMDAPFQARLRARAAEMRAAADLETWLALNATFHTELNEPSGAPLAIEICQQLRARGQRYLNLWSDGKGIDRPADANREHDIILDFIAAGDAAGAVAAIRQHVLTTRDKAIRYHELRAEPAR